jgi:hypothetical protein
MRYIVTIALITGLATLCCCHKVSEVTQRAELTPLEQGFRTSAAIGYCASLADIAFSGEPLPPNVSLNLSSKPGYTSSGVIHIHVDGSTPLPFSHSVGDIYIAGLWDGVNGGVISIVFGTFDIISSQFKFYGIYTVPVTKKPGTGTINTIFAQQDIIIGQGSDTLLNLSLSKPKFDAELARLNGNRPTDAFVAVKQNVWFVSVDRNNTPVNWYDDVLTINGGGQIVEAASTSGGILYHAMIETAFSYTGCAWNPLSGTAFIQNFKASGFSVDLGNITLQFHNTCDGKAQVVLATGKYFTSNGKNVDLGWQ